MSPAELTLCRGKQGLAAADKAKAAKEGMTNNPNRLRSSESFEEQEQRQKKKQRKERRRDNQIGGLLREVLSGEILARSLGSMGSVLLFASFLTILYLALGYQTERILREKQQDPRTP